jgi:hypothetical protein
MLTVARSSRSVRQFITKLSSLRILTMQQGLVSSRSKLLSKVQWDLVRGLATYDTVIIGGGYWVSLLLHVRC